MNELKKNLDDLKTILMDRLDAITADGKLVKDLLEEMEKQITETKGKK